VPTALQQAVWPTEDYELARSLVDTARPEDDLFAGIREAEELVVSGELVETGDLVGTGDLVA
jgi:hypothetical protein